MNNIYRIFYIIILCLSGHSVVNAQIIRQSTGSVYTSLQLAIESLPDSLIQDEVFEFQNSNSYNGPIVIEDIYTGSNKITIKAKGGTNPKIDAQNGTLGLIIDNTNNVIIEGIEFFNASKTDLSSTLIRVTNNSKGIYIENCYIHDARTGIRVTVNTDKVTVNNCQFNNIGFGAIRIDNFNEVRISNCTIDMLNSTPGGMGLRVVNGSGFYFLENTIFGTKDRELLSLITVNNIDIERNTFNNSGGAGIFIAPITGTTTQNDSIKIVDNLFYNNVEPSIFMENVKNTEIFNNTFDSKSPNSVLFAWKQNENISIVNNVFNVDSTGLPMIDIRTEITNATVNEFYLNYNLYKANSNRDLIKLDLNNFSNNYSTIQSIKSAIPIFSQNSLSGLIEFNRTTNINEPYYILKPGSIGINAGDWNASRGMDIRLMYKTNNRTDIGAYHRDASGISIDEQNINYIKIYPNPFKGHILLNTKQFSGDTIEVQLINQFGQTVFSEKLVNYNDEERINIPNIKSGVYHLQVKVNSIIYYSKLVK